MTWAIGMLSAALLGIFVAEAQARANAQPELVIVCERGGVTKDISHVASGSACVLHDRAGSSTSVGALSVYDDTMAQP